MGFKKNNPGCNCCAAGCAVASDDFNRANNADMDPGSTAGWTDYSGTWSISSNKAISTGAGIALCNTAQPDGDVSMIVTAVISHNTSGSACRLIAAAVDDANYFYAEYKIGQSQVVIGKVVAGVDTPLTGITESISTLAINTNYDAKICVNANGSVSAYFNNTVCSAVFGQTISGTYAGMAGVGSGVASFDNWTFDKAYNDPDATGCLFCHTPQWCSSCEDVNTMGAQAEVTVTGITNAACASCTTVNGITVVPFSSTTIETGAIKQCKWAKTGSVCFFSGNQFEVFLKYDTGADQTDIIVWVRIPTLTIFSTTVSGKVSCADMQTGWTLPLTHDDDPTSITCGSRPTSAFLRFV